MTKPLTDMEVFEKYVVRKGPGECWGWSGYRTPKGYGTVGRRGKPNKAHRLSLLLLGRSIPKGAVVRHLCNNPPCTNPEHLLIGTQADNKQDAMQCGRHAHGASHGMSKLSPDAVRAIRAAPTGYGTGTALSRRFGVSSGVIWKVRNGQSWRSVP